MVACGSADDSDTQSGQTPSGGNITTTTESAQWGGIYRLTSVDAATTYDTVSFSIGSGSCSFTLTSESSGWYHFVETNNCRLEYSGQSFPMVSNSSGRMKFTSWGSLEDTDMGGGGVSDDADYGIEVIDSSLTLTTNGALIRITKRVDGQVVRYAYNYSKS